MLIPLKDETPRQSFPAVNVLLILTDQLHNSPAYESEDLAAFRAEKMPGVERLRRDRNPWLSEFVGELLEQPAGW